MATVRLGKRTDAGRPKIKDFVPLASLDQLCYGGWDIYEDNAYQAASNAKVLDQPMLDAVRGPLESIQPMPAVFFQEYVTRINGPNVKKGGSKRDLAEML